MVRLVAGFGGGRPDSMAAFGPLRTLLVFPENMTAWNPAAWCGTRPTAHSAPRLSPALRAPPLCRCAERTADLILQSRWNAAHQKPPPERKGSERKGSGLVLQYRNARPDPRPLGTRWWSSAGKSGPRPPDHQKPSAAAGAARWGRFLGRRGAELEGRCAQRTSSSFWPRLSERRERSERSEFCGPTLGRAPQGSRRVQRPTAPV